MIKLKYPIQLNIEETIYNIVYTVPTKEQQKIIEEAGQPNVKAIGDFEEKTEKLNELIENKRLEDSLLSELEGAEKVKCINTIKKLNGDIKKAKALQKKAGDVPIGLDADEKRFELLITGDDKEKLLSDTKKFNVPLSLIMNEVEKELVKSREKK